MDCSKKRFTIQKIFTCSWAHNCHLQVLVGDRNASLVAFQTIAELSIMAVCSAIAKVGLEEYVAPGTMP